MKGLRNSWGTRELGFEAWGSKGVRWPPAGPSLPPLWPHWQGLGAPGSLELAGIKGRKALAH